MPRMAHPYVLLKSFLPKINFLTVSNTCRVDALHVLNMVMAAAPQHVTGTYLLPALQHYAHLLAPSQRARSVKAGSMKNLLEVQDPRVNRAAQRSNPGPVKVALTINVQGMEAATALMLHEI